MSVEPQLERSVLERKERDELQAIARALGAEPASRARKSELVDLILERAGVTIGASVLPLEEDVERPRRPRGRTTRQTTAAAPPTSEPTPDDVVPETLTIDEPPTADAAGDLPDRGDSDGWASPGEPAAAPDGTDRIDRDVARRPSDTVDDADARNAPGDGAADRRPRSGLRDRPSRPERPERPERAAPRYGDRAERRPLPEAETDDVRDDRPDRGRDDRSERAGRDDRAERTRGDERPDRDQDRDRDADGDADGQDRGSTDRSRDGVPDDPEAGRRRRRRGRDRDRPDDAVQGDPVECAGTLDLREEGYGFLRTSGSLPSRDDVYVSVKQVRQFGLRRGDLVEGASRPANRNEKNPALMRIDEVNGRDPEHARLRPRFADLTPVFPDERLRLETADATDVTGRVIDLVAPIGKGQRGLVVTPPRSGATSVLKAIADAVEANHPEVTLVVLLLDERPEEVTELRRSLRAEVVASTFDRPAEEHTQVADLVIERAKRLVEYGGDVVILLDGITRLARAHDVAGSATGRVTAGGIDAGALHPAKRFFGAARNLEEGGSLTIVATALDGTASPTDRVVLEEMTGAATMELRLDRRLAERRIHPAVDLAASGTRHEEHLGDPDRLERLWALRRGLAAAEEGAAAPGAGLERLLAAVRGTATNDEVLATVPGAPAT